jgi:hypothetical protein
MSGLAHLRDGHVRARGQLPRGNLGCARCQRDVVGRFRVRARGDGPIFVGRASSSAVDSYLAGVRQDSATNVYGGRRGLRDGGGLVLVLLGAAGCYAAWPRRLPQTAVTDARLERTAA